MSWKMLAVEIEGKGQMMTCCDKLSNPLTKEGKAYKALTAPRKKTDEQYVSIARLSYLSAFYTDDNTENGKIGLPSRVIEACFVAGAKSIKKGVDATSGIELVDSFYPLEFNGYKVDNSPTPVQIWDDYIAKEKSELVDVRSVVVSDKRIPRYRPIFNNWKMNLVVKYDDEILNPDAVKDIIFLAGKNKGIGDFRPKFGRFQISKISKLEAKA